MRAFRLLFNVFTSHLLTLLLLFLGEFEISIRETINYSIFNEARTEAGTIAKQLDLNPSAFPLDYNSY